MICVRADSSHTEGKGACSSSSSWDFLFFKVLPFSRTQLLTGSKRVDVWPKQPCPVAIETDSAPLDFVNTARFTLHGVSRTKHSAPPKEVCRCHVDCFNRLLDVTHCSALDNFERHQLQHVRWVGKPKHTLRNHHGLKRRSFFNPDDRDDPDEARSYDNVCICTLALL